MTLYLDCSPDPCNGHGTCQYTQIGFTFTCNNGYTGHTCASGKHGNQLNH